MTSIGIFIKVVDCFKVFCVINYGILLDHLQELEHNGFSSSLVVIPFGDFKSEKINLVE